MNTATLFKSFTAALGAFCGYFLGGWDAMLQVLVVLVILDYLSGVLAAGATGQLKSKVGFIGIAKKVMLFVFVAVAAQLELIFRDNGIDLHEGLRNATIFFYIGNEVLSLIENADRLGVKIPEQVANAVEIIGGKKEKEKEKGDVE